MLAYSAIAHAGYVLVGITAAVASGRSEGISSVLFYLTAYALMNVGVFVLVAHLSGAGERWLEMEEYIGLAYERPGLAACLTVFLLSLSGFPTTAGFFAKFYVFRAAVHSHLIGLTIVALLNGVVSVYYYLRLVVMMYMREGKTQASTASLPWPLGVAIAVTILGIFCLGLYPGPFVNLAALAASPLP
jgi:NADH-quinone oxidoreductase subunit N